MKKIQLIFLCALFFLGCKKEINIQNIETSTPVQEIETSPDFIQYTIQQGNQYCDQNFKKQVEYSELKFIVKFDSSAIYTTVDTSNQYDINKLYGFSDNNAEHQQFSARFGWRWSAKALRLFGYVYNEGIREWKELGTAIIDKENYCSIKVTPGIYIFTLNNITDSIPRKSPAITAKGYKLYPYFGGDETAPHKITIAIKEL